MPRYDYECDTCHHVFEIRQSFSSEPVANCPKCMNGAHRKIHAVPVVFKGSGWYVNDYGKGRGATNAAADSKDSSDSESKKDKKSKSESKSEAKSESKSEPAKASSK